MTSKDIQILFKELNINNEVHCSKNELKEFLLNGLLIESNNNYYDRLGNNVKVNFIKSLNFNLNFQSLINEANKLKYKKVYFMTSTCYNKYKQDGLIITKNNQDYYRFFDNDLWLVYKI